jgi:phosphate-selective porin
MKKFALILGIAGVLAAASINTAFAAETDTDKLINLLINKGVVNASDAAELRADIAIKNQDEKAAQNKFSVIASKQLKIKGYTQIRFQSSEVATPTTVGSLTSADGFDLRRARLDFSGNLSKELDYDLQLEFGGGNGTAINGKVIDAALGYTFSPEFKITAGEFKIPFSQENLASDSNPVTINRSLVVEGLVARGADVIGNQNGRDIGVQISGKLFSKDEDNTAYWINYAVAAVNGQGINAGDGNKDKDIVGRVVVFPIPGLSIGASFYNGFDKLTVAQAPVVVTPAGLTGQTRNRAGYEFAYVADQFHIQGEYIQGTDNLTNRDGWYVQTGYFFIPKQLQVVLKYDTYNTNTAAVNTPTTSSIKSVSIAGINWLINKQTILQVNYEIKDELPVIANNVLSVQFTAGF